MRLAIEGGDGLEGTQAGTELLDAETAGLWMAGKEFRRDQAVGDRVGKNEKTRVTCKLQQPGSGPPGREPAVSEDERKAMMAYYFKRQEELKRLAEVRDSKLLHGILVVMCARFGVVFSGGYFVSPQIRFCCCVRFEVENAS